MIKLNSKVSANNNKPVVLNQLVSPVIFYIVDNEISSPVSPIIALYPHISVYDYSFISNTEP